MTQVTSSAGILMIERFEGFSSRAYWDPYGKVWTDGYGNTNGVTAKSVVTQAQAQDVLISKLKTQYCPSILAFGENHFNQHQFDALSSFVWNCGGGSLSWEPFNTYLREKNWEAAATFMLSIDKSGGVTLPGLVTRRRTEVALFLTPMPNPLAIFPTSIGDTKFPDKGNERLLVQQVIGALDHPTEYKKYLATVLYPDLKEFRDRIYHLAHYEADGKPRPKVEWSPNSWGLRWQKLNDYMAQIDKL